MLVAENERLQGENLRFKTEVSNLEINRQILKAEFGQLESKIGKELSKKLELILVESDSLSKALANKNSELDAAKNNFSESDSKARQRISYLESKLTDSEKNLIKFMRHSHQNPKNSENLRQSLLKLESKISDNNSEITTAEQDLSRIYPKNHALMQKPLFSENMVLFQNWQTLVDQEKNENQRKFNKLYSRFEELEIFLAHKTEELSKKDKIIESQESLKLDVRRRNSELETISKNYRAEVGALHQKLKFFNEDRLSDGANYKMLSQELQNTKTDYHDLLTEFESLKETLNSKEKIIDACQTISTTKTGEILCLQKTGESLKTKYLQDTET